MLTDHQRVLIAAFFEAADFDKDGVITAEDIADVCSVSTGKCNECNEHEHALTIYFEEGRGITLEELIAFNASLSSSNCSNVFDGSGSSASR